MRRSRPLIPALNLFAAISSVLYDALTGWDTAGFIWSIWLTSLLLGFLIMVNYTVQDILTLCFLPEERPVSPQGQKIFLTFLLFTLIFFTLHFGGFHLGQALFLNSVFPITTIRTPSDIFTIAIEAFRRFWPMALFNLVTEYETFASGITGADKRPPVVGLITAMGQQYGLVLRLHFTIIALTGIKLLLPVAGFPVYAVVYLTLFVPFARRNRT